jgi:hypothetical protein
MSETSWCDREVIIRLHLARPDVRGWWPTERSTYNKVFASYFDRLLSESFID